VDFRAQATHAEVGKKRGRKEKRTDTTKNFHRRFDFLRSLQKKSLTLRIDPKIHKTWTQEEKKMPTTTHGLSVSPETPIFTRAYEFSGERKSSERDAKGCEVLLEGGKKSWE